MKRRRSSTGLRGSVTQHTPTVRMRAEPKTRFGFLIRLTAAAGSLLLVFALITWLWHIGWPQRQVGRALDAGLHVTQKAQFAVKDISVEGRQQTSKEMLSVALGLTAGAPIFGFNINDAQTRIAKLPWVSSVTIERRLPDTVRVRLVERVPLARWQHDNHLVVIDQDGKELADARPEQFAALPLVVGAGAPDDAADLLATIKDFPDIDQLFMAAVRVGERRWDVHLQPKIVVRGYRKAPCA